VDHIAQTVLEVGDRVRRAAGQRHTELPECHIHPGQKALNCDGCAQDQLADLAAMREQSRQDAIRRTHDDLTKFPPRFRDATATHPEVLNWATQFATEDTTPTSLLLLGSTGVGKTWQAYGALRQAVTHPVPVRSGYRCRAWIAAPFADLMARMRPRPRVDSEEVMAEYRAADLLLVDDLAAAKGSEWVEEQTYRLINGRYEDMLPTIFTTNLALGELREAIGDRIASRLAETCTRVVLTGADRRRVKAAAT
jgi:DNA replication protein DnaC